MKQTNTMLPMSDGQPLNSSCWSPELPVKAAIALVHGFGEHIGRYQDFATYFCTLGYGVCAVDLRGHGKTAGKRGCIPSYGQLLQDVGTLIDHTNAMFAGVPIFLYGHSMGGNLCLNYTLHGDCAALRGVILSAPWLELFEPKPAMLCRTVAVLSHLLPNLTLDAGLNYDALTSDEKKLEAVKADPLYHGKISLRLFTAIDQNGRLALASSPKKVLPPILLMQGLGDRIVSASANEKLAKRLRGQIEYRSFAQFNHELHNERNAALPLKTAYDWMEAHR